MNSRKKTLIVSALVPLAVLVLSSCSTDGGIQASGQASASSPSPAAASPTPSTTQPSTNQTGAQVNVTGEAGKAPTIEAPTGTPPSELVVKDIYPGTGAEVKATSTLTVQYTLMAWSTGKIVETSWTGSPATFPLAGVIQGWQQGLPGMKVGGRRLLVIPPALGYGSNAQGPIAANETLIFVVDLLGVK